MPSPAYDAQVSVFGLKAERQTARVRVVIRERSRGSRLQTQYWRLEGGQWVFDARRTLSVLSSHD